jgi:hypothetical protein
MAGFASARRPHPRYRDDLLFPFFVNTLLMPREPLTAPVAVNVPGLSLAGFQGILIGSLWVIPESCGTSERFSTLRSRRRISRRSSSSTA